MMSLNYIFYGMSAGFSRTQDIVSFTLKNKLVTPKKSSCASFGTGNNLLRSEERINDYVLKSNSCIKFGEFTFDFAICLR